jgi:DNA-binding Xre family transcriptional regulator
MIRLKIKEIAAEKGISQRKLSIRSEVDIKTIQKIYRYPTSIITTETLDKIAKVLNVDASELIESIPDQKLPL